MISIIIATLGKPAKTIFTQIEQLIHAAGDDAQTRGYFTHGEHVLYFDKAFDAGVIDGGNDTLKKKFLIKTSVVARKNSSKALVSDVPSANRAMVLVNAYSSFGDMDDHLLKGLTKYSANVMMMMATSAGRTNIMLIHE